MPVDEQHGGSAAAAGRCHVAFTPAWYTPVVRTMSKTTLESLEKRVAALEQGMARWLHVDRDSAAHGAWRDWRLAVGRFTPSELSEEVDAAGREIREASARSATST